MASGEDSVVGCPASDENTANREPNGPGVTNFTRSGEFIYDVAMGERDARMTVAVDGPSTGDRKVTIRYDVGTKTETFDSKAGGIEAVRDELATTSVAPFVSLIRFPSIAAVADIETLPTGQRFPVPGTAETVAVEVTEVDSRSRSDRYRSTWRCNGTVRYTDCITLDTRCKTAATYFTDDAEPFVRVELAETTIENPR